MTGSSVAWSRIFRMGDVEAFFTCGEKRMRAGREQHIPNFRVQWGPMSALKLMRRGVVHLVAWNRRCLLFLQYASCLLDIRAELVVTSLTKKYISSCSATGEMVENQLVANDIRGTVEIMTIHRAVLLPSSNSAKFSHRDGWRGSECRSSSL